MHCQEQGVHTSKWSSSVKAGSSALALMQFSQSGKCTACALSLRPVWQNLLQPPATSIAVGQHPQGNQCRKQPLPQGPVPSMRSYHMKITEHSWPSTVSEAWTVYWANTHWVNMAGSNAKPQHKSNITEISSLCLTWQGAMPSHNTKVI